MAELIGQQLGNYSLTRLLGQGGFADVYLGEHIFLKSPVAVKVLQGRITPQDLQDFITEAQTIALLKHPHIVRILDFGIERNIPFLVMDFASNGTLGQRHPHGSRLSLTTIIPYLRQVADALQYAHSQKRVHRDVKPENMLVDANNDILLSDFGIVVIAHRTQSFSVQEAMGTAQYMAPEQIQGKARPASDQYSLGVVVYEWLTGILPFTGATSIEIAMNHLSVPPQPFQKELQIPPQVEQVVLKALAKDPEQRFTSVEELVTALEHAYQPYQPTILQPLPNLAMPATPPSPVAQNPNSALPPTLRVQQPTVIASSPTNIPSPPLIIQNLTEEQIYQALIAQNNPYAPWGTLVYNDEEKNMWQTSKGGHVIGEYIGNVFYKTIEGTSDKFHDLYEGADGTRAITLVKPEARLHRQNPQSAISSISIPKSPKPRGFFRSFFSPSYVQRADEAASPTNPPNANNIQLDNNSLIKDFAFQTQIKMNPNISAWAGVVFRADAAMKLFYSFFIGGITDRGFQRYGYSIYAGENRLATRIKCPAIQPNKPNLLAVVAQGATFHFYINLELVASIEDTSIVHAGSIGLLAFSWSTLVGDTWMKNWRQKHIEYSYGKLWQKNIS